MDGQKYLGLLDMIDGGGMGRAGQRFEGGGLLSDIANALARPAGYMERMAAVRPQARPMQAGLPDMPMIQTPPPQQGQSPFEMFGGQPPAPYTPPTDMPLPDLLGTMADARAMRAAEMFPTHFGGQGSNYAAPQSGVAGGRGTVTGPSAAEAFMQQVSQMFPPQQIQRMQQRGDLDRLFQQYLQSGGRF
jgi:hypothetical protein